MDDQTSQLHTYIQQHMHAGTSVDDIRKPLLEAGWDPKMVDDVLQQYTTPESDKPVEQTPVQPGQPGIVPAATPKYKLFQSISDTVKAIKQNALTFFLSIIIAFVGVILILTVPAMIFGIVMGGRAGESSIFTPFDSAATFIIFFIGILLFGALLNALVQTVASVSLNDGAEGRKSSLKDVFRYSLQRVLKVVLTNLLVGIIVVGPLIFIAVIGFLSLLTQINSGGGSGAGAGAAIGLALASLLAVVWMLIAMLRFALAPIVAIFEPEVSVVQTLKRSYHLLQQGGQWFILKGVALILLVAIIVSAITGQDVNELQSSDDWFSNVVFLIMEVFVVGSLVMLYRNRKAVKASQDSKNN